MPANPADPDKSAWEELKILQDIIGRYDGHMLKVKNWATALATAIVVFGFATHASLLMTMPFAAISLFLVYLVELLFRRVQNSLIGRVASIEEYLRGESPSYSGPHISDAVKVRPRRRSDKPKTPNEIDDQAATNTTGPENKYGDAQGDSTWQTCAEEISAIWKLFLRQPGHPGVWLQYVILLGVVAGMLTGIAHTKEADAKVKIEMTDPKEKTDVNFQWKPR